MMPRAKCCAGCNTLKGNEPSIMNVRYEDLHTHLRRSLAPVYIVSGDEPLQLGEACDLIRQQARAQHFAEREVMHVEKGFDWDQFLTSINSLSLFAEKKVLELRMASAKPGDKGAKALITFAQDVPPDILLLIVCGKVDKATQRSKWFSALEAIGVSLQIWPVDVKALPQWIRRRMQQKGMQPTNDAAQLLSDRVEGNLLAAAQEIEKLLLLHGEGNIDGDTMAEAVADSARYDIYALADAALNGDGKRVVKMLSGLHAEGAEPVLLVWVITRELRSLVAMARQVQNGNRIEQVIAGARVWPKRKALVAAALHRHPVDTWLGMLQQAARLDRLVKGMRTGNVWDELLQLYLRVAGTRLFAATP
jgi:DNA polymerase-3 subunit delta